MNIQMYFRDYKKRSVKKYPTTVKYNVDVLLNQQVIGKLNNNFYISFDEIN